MNMDDREFKAWKMNTLDPILELSAPQKSEKVSKKTGEEDGKVLDPYTPVDSSTMTEADLLVTPFLPLMMFTIQALM